MKNIIKCFLNTLLCIFLINFNYPAHSEIIKPEAEAPPYLEKEAKTHRQQGLKAQQSGLYDEAITFYKKAIMLDPLCVDAYNDLGVVYEIKGLLDLAEEYYQKALSQNSFYLPAYYNLAALYEKKGDLKKAAEYWQKRIRLGLPDDPWTVKAVQHLKNISFVVKELAQQLREEEIIDLVESVKRNPALISSTKEKDEKNNKIKYYLDRAEVNLKEKNYISALNNAAISKHLDPTNTRAQTIIDEAHKKIREETYRR